MSFSAIYITGMSGEMRLFRKLNNAWKGAPFVWDSIYNKYLINEQHELDAKWKRIFEWAETPHGLENLEPFERNVLYSTCDNVLLRVGDFRLMSESMRKFCLTFGHLQSNNLWRQTLILEELCVMDALKEKIRAVGWWLNSVNATPWHIFDLDLDDEIVKNEPYNIDNHHNHVFLDLVPLNQEPPSLYEREKL